MSLTHQAAYFVDYLYGTDFPLHNKGDCTGNGSSLPKTLQLQPKQPVPDSWNISFGVSDKSNIAIPFPERSTSLDHGKNVPRAGAPLISEQSASGSALDDLPNADTITDDVAFDHYKKACLQPNSSPDSHSSSFPCNTATENSGPINPLHSALTNIESTSDKEGCHSSDSKAASTKMDATEPNTIEIPLKYGSFESLDTNAIFGDEEDELERIIEEEKKGAAWRTCPETDLNQLRSPFQVRCEETVQDTEAPPTCKGRENPIARCVESCQPATPEEQHKQFLAWARKMYPRDWSIPADLPCDMLRVLLIGRAFQHLDPMELLELHEHNGSLPRGASGHWRPRHQYPLGTKGCRGRWSTRLWNVTNADEEPPISTSPTPAEDEVPALSISSDDEDEEEQLTSLTLATGYGGERCLKAGYVDLLPQDGRESRAGFREDEEVGGVPGEEIGVVAEKEDGGSAAEQNKKLEDEELVVVPVEPPDDHEVGKAEESPPVEIVPPEHLPVLGGAPDIYGDYSQEAILDRLWSIKEVSVVIATELMYWVVDWFALPIYY